VEKRFRSSKKGYGIEGRRKRKTIEEMIECDIRTAGGCVKM